MVDRFLSLLRYGVENGTGVTEKRKIQHANTIVVIAGIFYPAYVVFYAICSQSSVVFRDSAFVVLAFIPLLSIPIILNKLGRLRLARWAIGLNYSGVVLALILFGQGNHFNAHFYFLAFSTIHFTYFPLSQWPDVVFLFLLNMSLFVIGYVGLIPPHPDVHLVGPSFAFGFGLVNVLLSAVITGAMFFAAEYMAAHSEDALESLSSTDSLTGLLNRHGFTARFEEERRRCGRSENVGALVFFDLNKFKALNDEHGHDAGDLLLKEVARRIRSSLRATDVVARMGGDEFVALMCPAGSSKDDALAQAKATASTIRKRLSDAYSLEIGKNTVRYECSSSIGVATYDESSNREDVLRQADQAMYTDKKEGA
jgi:diguanylate cyclase (GGDEF)-like protein